VRLGIVAGVAVAARVAYVLLLAPDRAECCDRLFYHLTANLLADGHGYVKPVEFLEEGRSLPTAGHPPLYPFLLAVVSWFGGETYATHRAVGIVVGAATVVAIGLLGRRVGGERVGIVAAAIAALYPTFLGADGSGMSESLYGLGIAVALLATFRLVDRPTAANAAALGVVIGLAALVRGEAVLLLGVLALPAFRRIRPRRLRVSVLACAATALVVVPWLARNWAAFDRPVGISTNYSGLVGGANCRITYHGPDTGSWHQLCFQFPDRDNEAEQADIIFRRGRSYALDHPGRLPVVVAVRLLRTWSLYQPRRSTYLTEGRRPGAEQAGLALYYLLVALSLYGLVALRPPRDTTLVLLAPVALACAVSVVGYGNPRFRHAAEISLIVLGSLTLVRCYQARRPARHETAGA
jgi:4-amino-4-deoxy-L-arabinose transferase-like glycosyltransferase